MIEKFEISESKEYGVILKINDTELADEFDDYLTENSPISYSLKFSESNVEFFLGRFVDVEHIQNLVTKFLIDR